MVRANAFSIVAFLLYLMGSNPLAAQKPVELLIRNAHVIDPVQRTLKHVEAVGVHNGQISYMGKDSRRLRTASTVVINGQGAYLMAGLADMHVHLPATQVADTFLLYQLLAGVTTIRQMNSKEDALATRKRVEAEKLLAPAIYFSYPEYTNRSYSAEQADSIMQSIRQDGYHFIKVFRMANDTTLRNYLAAAQKHRLIVAGHYPSKKIPLEGLLLSGFKSLEHLGGYDQLLDSASLQQAIVLTVQAGVFNCPTLDYDYINWKLSPQPALMSRSGVSQVQSWLLESWKAGHSTNPPSQGFEEAQKRQRNAEKYAAKVKLLHALDQAGALLLVGSDPSLPFQVPGFNIYEEMQRMQEAGLSPFTILKAATYNAALFFGEEKQWGSVTVGKKADLILLGQNPIADISNISSVLLTIQNGIPYYRNMLERKLGLPQNARLPSATAGNKPAARKSKSFQK